jgi:flotillin
MFGVEPLLMVGGLLCIGSLLLLAWMGVALFQKCSVNEAMIITGAGAGFGDRKFKIVVGGGCVVIPMFQMCTRMNIAVMNIEVRPKEPMTTKDGVPVFAEGVARVKVKRDDDSIAIYAENFLGKSDEEITRVIHDRLIEHLRTVFGTMTNEELTQSSDAFAQTVLEVSLADLAKMGLTIDSFTIRETAALREEAKIR